MAEKSAPLKTRRVIRKFLLMILILLMIFRQGLFIQKDQDKDQDLEPEWEATSPVDLR